MSGGVDGTADVLGLITPVQWVEVDDSGILIDPPTIQRADRSFISCLFINLSTKKITQNVHNLFPALIYLVVHKDDFNLDSYLEQVSPEHALVSANMGRVIDDYPNIILG